MALISIIVPVYNVELYLNECVSSILKQTFTDFELILVDDGSPDRCPTLCDEYAKRDKRVRVIHKENGGLSSARNAGLNYVFSMNYSDYITFIDSDDFVNENYLDCLLNELLTNQCDMSVCYQLLTENEKKKQHRIDAVVDNLDYWKIGIESPIDVVSWGKLYKKHLFASVRFPEGKIHEDEFVIHRLVGQCNLIRIVPISLYFYRKRPDSIMQVHAYDEQRQLIIMEFLLDRVAYYVSNNTFLFEMNFNRVIKSLKKNYKKLHHNGTYKTNFNEAKKYYKKIPKSVKTSLFLLFPRLYFLFKNIKHVLLKRI